MSYTKIYRYSRVAKWKRMSSPAFTFRCTSKMMFHVPFCAPSPNDVPFRSCLMSIYFTYELHQNFTLCVHKIATFALLLRSFLAPFAPSQRSKRRSFVKLLFSQLTPFYATQNFVFIVSLPLSVRCVPFTLLLRSLLIPSCNQRSILNSSLMSTLSVCICIKLMFYSLRSINAPLYFNLILCSLKIFTFQNKF